MLLLLLLRPPSFAKIAVHVRGFCSTLEWSKKKVCLTKIVALLTFFPGHSIMEKTGVKDFLTQSRVARRPWLSYEQIWRITARYRPAAGTALHCTAQSPAVHEGSEATRGTPQELEVSGPEGR